MEYKIIPVRQKEDIPKEYQDTPIGRLLEYHNLNRQFDIYLQAQLLIGTCMDNREHFNIPDNFAFILRSGGANLRYSEFKVSYAIAIGKVRYIALIGHNDCGMVDLISKKEEFINGMADRAGWSKESAEENFMNSVPLYEIGNEVEFVMSEADRLNSKYPKIYIAPLYYKIEDSQLYCILKTS